MNPVQLLDCEGQIAFASLNEIDLARMCTDFCLSHDVKVRRSFKSDAVLCVTFLLSRLTEPSDIFQ